MNILSTTYYIIGIIVLLVILYATVTEIIERRKAKRSAALAIAEMEKQVRLAATKAEKTDA